MFSNTEQMPESWKKKKEKKILCSFNEIWYISFFSSRHTKPNSVSVFILWILFTIATKLPNWRTQSIPTWGEWKEQSRQRRWWKRGITLTFTVNGSLNSNTDIQSVSFCFSSTSLFALGCCAVIFLSSLFSNVDVNFFSQHLDLGQVILVWIYIFPFYIILKHFICFFFFWLMNYKTLTAKQNPPD